MADRKKTISRPRVMAGASQAAALARRALALRAIPEAMRFGQRTAPFLSMVRAPRDAVGLAALGDVVSVATYNVHRWMGISGRRRPDPLHAHLVISELDADVIALQEVLRPAHTRDPLEALCDDLGLHVAFAVTRVHKRGQLGNAILSRLPITAASVLDISHSRIERRGALGARFSDGMGRSLGVVATHLSLVDRTRERQVKSLLSHPQFESGPSVLLGDMNAWRRSKAIQTLDAELSAHKNSDWPASYPSARPVLALDRVYVRGAKVLEVHAHDTAAARRASDHLPVIAHIEIPHAAPRS
ncbi:MAG: endonuclease/exonuclease/phosphatase family protein [Myxococcota bacterium]|jgi:endonuclease/exonuclease/phosphatase family metal-dependent hydrolase